MIPFVSYTPARNEDREERNRKASYDVKEGTADCEERSVWTQTKTQHDDKRMLARPPILTQPRLRRTVCRLCDVRSPTPTLDEVHTWGQSFDKLMGCPVGRAAFRLFLRTEFSEENMLFWMACEEFTKETNKTAIEEKARVIYEDYISILSPKEV